MHANLFFIRVILYSLTYPEVWDNPSLSKTYLHETSIGCCNKFFDGNIEACSPLDVCAAEDASTTVAPQTTEVTEMTSTETTTAVTSDSSEDGENKLCSSSWFPDHVHQDGCTNSIDFPKDWNDEDDLFYGTWSECCEAFFFGADLECVVRDSCKGDGEVIVANPASNHTIITSSSTEPPVITDPPETSTVTPDVVITNKCRSNQWHPDNINMDGCSNSLEYPSEWDTKSYLFFASAEECCDSSFFRGQSCQVYKECEEEEETVSSRRKYSVLLKSMFDMINSLTTFVFLLTR